MHVDEMAIKFTDKFIVGYKDVEYENGIPSTLLIKNIPKDQPIKFIKKIEYNSDLSEIIEGKEEEINLHWNNFTFEVESLKDVVFKWMKFRINPYQ